MDGEKISLWKFINPEKEKKSDFPWAIQIIQNILAVAEMIPLRLYDADAEKASKIRKELNCSLEDLKELVDPNIKSFQFLEKHKEFFGNRENSPWLTLSSYGHPLLDEFHREFPVFRVWEQIFIYSWIKEIKDNKPNIKPFFEHLWIGIQKIDVDGFKGFLVAGPVFMEPLKENTKGFEADRIDPFIEKILKETKYRSDSNYKEKSKILAFRRPWCHKNDLGYVLAKSARAMESILNCNIPSPCDFQRDICRYVALTARVLYSQNLENEIIKLVYSGRYDFDLVLNNIELNFPIPFHKKPHCVSAVWRDKKWCIEVKEEVKETEFDLSIKLNLEKEQSFFNRIPRGFLTNPDILDKQASGKNDDSIEEAKKSVKSLYWGLYRRIISIEESYAQERLAILRESFDHNFESLSEEKEKFYNKICREVAILMNADACSIHLYEVSSDTLKMEGYYFPLKSKLENLREKLKDLKKSDQNIRFKVVESGEPSCLPDKQTESEVTDDVKSGIYAPLKIHGHVLGVVGILGTSPHQFRSHNEQLLLRICQSLSPYLYQAIFLSGIRDITQRAIEVSSEEGETSLYHDICKQFSAIFLSYSAVLWEPDRNKANQYLPKGWMKNRSELKDMLAEGSKDIYLDINDSTSFIKKGLDQLKEKPGPFASVKFEGDKDHHRMKRHRKWLIKNEIEHLNVIPIRTAQSGEFIALMVLYHRKPGYLDQKQWGQIAQFMADFLALLLEARMAYKQWEQRIRNTITHDMRTQIKGIQNRANDILKALPQGYKIRRSYEHGKINTPAYKVVNDMAAYTKHLSRLLNVFEDKKALDKMRKTHVHPLLVMHEIDPERNEKVNLRKMFNEVFRPTWSERRKKDLKDNYAGPDNGHYLLIPPSYLRNILENLVSNAVKYALPNTGIEAVVEITDYSVELRLSNRAECFKEEGEEYSIFNEGYRGTNAENIEGQGMGLHHARLYCELADGELSVEVSEKKERHCLFTFIVSLPRRGRLIEDNN